MPPDDLLAIRSYIAALRAEMNQRLDQLDKSVSMINAVAPTLTARQKAVLERLCKGEGNKQIGRALNLPETTIKVHVREIIRKLNVSNRTQAAIIAARMKLV